MTFAKIMDHDSRICEVEGCNKLGKTTGKILADGTKARKPRCDKHHREHYAAQRGMTPTQWSNSFHPYKKYRKDYCENKDSRLGFTCTASIVWEGQLQVDHINGDHSDNSPKNLQTLCANCHSAKTHMFEDRDDKKGNKMTLSEMKKKAKTLAKKRLTLS